jgi:CheY-like chemotaxis protein
MSKKILLVEDEKIMINLLEKKLKQEGYDVTVALDGEDGLEKMKEIKPDIVLLDIIMPKKGGFEVMEEMNEDSELKKIPVVIISNSGQPIELGRARELGAKDWLIKTEFDPQEVLDKVVQQIGKP